MRNVYITLVLAVILVLGLLSASFFYLDWHRRQTFLYEIYRDNTLVGYEKVDRYILENRVIYKSATELPRDMLNRKDVRRAAFDVRGKDFIDYKKETVANGAKSLVYVANGPDGISFLASGNAAFSFLEKIPVYGNDIVFESMSASSYPPLVRRYNFKKRGEQFINVLEPVSAFLPPARHSLSVKSIGTDTIEIEGRKTSCERLALELKNGDLVMLWTTRTFHNVLMVKIPKHGFKAVLCSGKKAVPVEEYVKKSGLYTEENVTFNNDEIALHGNLSVPKQGKGPYPAVMLIWDSGPMDKSAIGIFTDIAHHLAESGYCVFRFDKRGIGRSRGSFSTYAQPEEISDLDSAVGFLMSRPEVDKKRIALLGHSEGGFYAAYLAGSNSNIRACVIVSALSSLNPLKNDCSKASAFIKRAVPDDSEYLDNTLASIKQNREIVKDKGDWITLLGNRVFTKKMALENEYDPVDAIKKVNVPVLILHGKKDRINLDEEAKELTGALAKAGNNNFTAIYFGELGHYFGTEADRPPVRDHIQVDAEVLSSLKSWLKENLLPPPPEAVSGPEITETGEILEAPQAETSLDAGPPL